VASDNQTRGNLPAKMNPTDTSSLSHITMADTRLHSAACKLEPGPNYRRTEGVRCKRFMRDEERFSGLDASFLRDETPLLTRHLFSPSPLSSTSSTPLPTVLPSARPASTCWPASIHGHPSSNTHTAAPPPPPFPAL
jgi:hypothetical protein